MAKHFKKFLKSFTLIELIIVIAIIAVLGVAAGLLLNQWMSKGRDSQRISDLAKIKSAIDIAFTKDDKLPLPDGANVLLYTGTEILYQGIFGEHAVKSIGSLNKVPKDRVNGEYEYSLLYDKRTYRVKAILENETYKVFMSNNAYAKSEYYFYIGKDIKAVLVNDTFIYLPSMFISGYDENGRYDLYENDFSVFEGDKVGEYKSGFALPVEEIELIKTTLVNLGVQETQVNQILAQGTGQPQIVLQDKCGGVLPSNSIINGEQVAGKTWTYNEISGECNYICEIGYENINGGCELEGTGLASCEGILPNNSIINGVQVEGKSWSYSETTGDCNYKCKSGYEYINGNCEEILVGGGSCGGVLPANSIINGVQVDGKNWEYSDLPGECNYICKFGYSNVNGKCEKLPPPAGTCKGELSIENATINVGTPTKVDTEWQYAFTGNCTWKCIEGYTKGQGQECITTSNLTWIGLKSINWFDVDNWSESRLPSQGDIVSISSATTFMPEINLTNGSVEIAGLNLGNNTLVVTGGNDTKILNINGNLQIMNGGTLTQGVSTTNYLNLRVGGKLQIDSGGKIDVTGKSSNTAFGLSHAGIGYTDLEARIHGDIYDPKNMGSKTNQLAGGVVLIQAGELINNGGIYSNGNSNTCGGCRGGSGGSINIRVSGNISGSGVYTANGGNGEGSGDGGSGRIAIRYATVSNYDSLKNSITAATLGGYGGAGTIYLLNTTTGEEELILKGNSINNKNTTIVIFNGRSSYSFQKITVTGGAKLVLGTGTSLTAGSCIKDASSTIDSNIVCTN